jgi:hypothetical protein
MKTKPKVPGNSAPDSTAPRASQLRDGLAATLASADSGTAQTVQNLKLVHQARVSQLNRTAAALKKQLGPDDPTVKAAEAAAKAGSLKVAHITAIHQQIATPTPEVSSTGWALQGRVYSSTLHPATALTVFLVDAQHAWQRQYGFAYTDSNGYFLINYPGSTDPASGATDSAPQLFLEIVNKSAKPIYLSTEPFQPTQGSTTYKTITLPAGEHPIGDPPPEIREIAIPTTKRKR